MIKSTAHFCSLLSRIFERHGHNGDRTLHTVRPWRGGSFRDGLTEYHIIKRAVPVKIIMLWYECDIGNGKFTSRAVRIREVIREPKP